MVDIVQLIWRVGSKNWSVGSCVFLVLKDVKRKFYASKCHLKFDVWLANLSAMQWTYLMRFKQSNEWIKNVPSCFVSEGSLARNSVPESCFPELRSRLHTVSGFSLRWILRGWCWIFFWSLGPHATGPFRHKRIGTETFYSKSNAVKSVLYMLSVASRSNDNTWLVRGNAHIRPSRAPGPGGRCREFEMF